MGFLRALLSITFCSEAGRGVGKNKVKLGGPKAFTLIIRHLTWLCEKQFIIVRGRDRHPAGV